MFFFILTTALIITTLRFNLITKKNLVSDALNTVVVDQMPWGGRKPGTFKKKKINVTLPVTRKNNRSSTTEYFNFCGHQFSSRIFQHDTGLTANRNCCGFYASTFAAKATVTPVFWHNAQITWPFAACVGSIDDNLRDHAFVGGAISKMFLHSTQHRYLQNSF